MCYSRITQSDEKSNKVIYFHTHSTYFPIVRLVNLHCVFTFLFNYYSQSCTIGTKV